jgi:hypothetical protein
MTNYVYAIYSSGCVKIGVSTDPKKRVGKVSADCPHPVVLKGYVEGGYELEAELHAKFCDFRVKGEWFSFDGPVADWVSSLPDRSGSSASTLSEYFKANRGKKKLLAERLGLQPSTVSQWRSIPVEYLPEVADFTGLKREDLCPDAFRPARESA